MNKLELAKEFRAMIEANLTATRKLIRVDELDPEELEEMINLYDRYKLNHTYAKDDIFQYKGKLYKVIKGLTSQEDWAPDTTPSEYLPMQPEDVIPEWKQPTGGHDSYSIGDKVIYNDEVYESIIDSNTWSPTDYPQGWKKVE